MKGRCWERSSNNGLQPNSDALVPSSFLLLIVRPGATSSILAPSSDALCYWEAEITRFLVFPTVPLESSKDRVSGG